MFLKKVEFVGFKSFADKTVLHFPEGISGVVGPNGSGKSNITDGIRWALGEQSIKSLRGGSMEDVIFSGTSSKNAFSRASVSITISNERGLLPIDFKEVTVTRQIFRSGETHYMINNSRCRLKDIVELFMDTGLSKGSYSIISQGQIGAILTANPYERRVLFEEAAGIIKYKARKKMAISKLESTRQDLLRVNDILLELERQLRSLKYQAAKADRYQSLSRRLEFVELNMNFLEYNRLKDEIALIKEDRKKFQDQKTEFETEVNKYNSEIEKNKLKLIEYDSEINQVSQKIYEFSEDIKNAEFRIVSNNGKIENLNFKISKFNEENESIKEKAFDFKSSIEQDAGGLIQFEKEFLETEIDKSKLNKELEIIEKEISETEQELEKLKNEIFTKTSLTSENRNRLTAIERDLKNFETKKDELAITKSELLEKLYNLQNEIVILKQNSESVKKNIDKVAADLEHTVQEKDKITKNLNDLVQKNSEYKESLLECKSELKVIEDTENDKYIDALKQLLDENEKRNDEQIFAYSGIIGEHIKTDAKYETAIGNALNNLVQTLILESEKDVFKAVEILKDKGLGKVSFVVEEKFFEHKQVIFNKVLEEDGVIDAAANLITIKKQNIDTIIYSLFSKYIVAETFNDCLKLIKKYPQYNFVSLDGEIFFGDGSITAGKEKETRNILKRDRKKQELKEKIEFLNNTINENDKVISEYKLKIEKNNEIIDNLSKQKNNLIIELAAIENKFKHADNSIIELNINIEKIAVTENEIEQNIKKLLNESAELSQTIQNLNQTTEQIKSRLDNLIMKSASIKNKKEETSAKLTNIKVHSAELNQKRENTKRAIEYYKKMINELDFKTSDNQKQIEQCHKELKDTQAEIEYINNELNKKILEKEKFLDEKKNLSSKREELNIGVLELEKIIKEKNRIISGFLENIHQFDIKLSQRETKLDNIFENIFNKHQLDLETFLSKKWIEKFTEEEISEIKDMSVEDMLNETRSVEAKIKALGPVNINAINEYNEVSQRYEFLNKQKTDLEQAEKDLNNVIEKINIKAQEKFMDTFEKVKINFKNIINELFEGGEADLSLIEPDNILETGIDISVKPPGKKIQNISLLSGGEKAMSAIGLLFSLFKVKPSPLCILDEIDAPLDDVNIGRFLKVLKKFAEQSQFIIITHHKKTMAACEVLYGVAMEEKGITKVISVKLAESKKNEEMAG